MINEQFDGKFRVVLHGIDGINASHKRVVIIVINAINRFGSAHICIMTRALASLALGFLGGALRFGVLFLATTTASFGRMFFAVI